MPETYDEEAVQEILRLALIKQGQDGSLLRSQLVEIAEELGISEAVLAAAEEEWQVQAEEQQARTDFAVYRHQQLRQGIVRFIIINSFLVLLNGVTAHRIDWSVYPVLIWGMAIMFQAWQVLQSEGEQYDRAFRRWRLRQQIGESFKAIAERLKLSWRASSGHKSATSGSDGKSTPDPFSSDQNDANLRAQSTDTITLPSAQAKQSTRNQGQLNQGSSAQKSRKQNRISQHIAYQNRSGHLPSSSSKERD